MTNSRRHRGMPTGTAVPVIDRVDPLLRAYAIGSRLIARASATPSATARTPTVPSSFTSLSLGTFAFVYAATGDWIAAATTSAPAVASPHHSALNLPCLDISRHLVAPSAGRHALP